MTVDRVTRGQSLFQIHRPDDVTKSRHGQLLDTDDVAGDFVRGRLRVGHLEVHDGVDGDNQVVLGDHRLRGERGDLLTHIHSLANPIHERHQDAQTWRQGALVATEAFDDGGAGLVDDHDRPPQQEGDDDECEDDTADECDHLISSPLTVGLLTAVC